VLFVNT